MKTENGRHVPRYIYVEQIAELLGRGGSSRYVLTDEIRCYDKHKLTYTSILYKVTWIVEVLKKIIIFWQLPFGRSCWFQTLHLFLFWNRKERVYVLSLSAKRMKWWRSGRFPVSYNAIFNCFSFPVVFLLTPLDLYHNYSVLKTDPTVILCMVLWFLMPCGLVGRYRRFGEPYAGLNMRTVCFADTLVSTDESTRRQNPEHYSPHRQENLKSRYIISIIIIRKAVGV